MKKETLKKTNSIPNRSQKNITPEIIALRKMRELKNLTRKDAAVLFGCSFKLLEKIENGRGYVNQERIEHFTGVYGFSKSDFLDICQGKIEKVKAKIGYKRPEIIKNNKLRRSYKRIITKEVVALKTLRLRRKLNQYDAARLCNYATCAIGHIENGRIELRPQKIEHIVTSYGYTMDDFKKEVSKGDNYSLVLEDCVSILKDLTDEKLITVHNLLKTFSTNS